MTAPLRLSAYFGVYFLYAGAFVPYFTLYLAARGLDAAAIALIMAMPQLARIAAPSFWGWLADRSGRGRAIVIGSSAVLVAGYAALATLEQAGAIAGVMLLMSVLAAGALPIIEAITLSALEGRAERYGPVRLWGSVGFIVGVMGTGLWLDAHAPQSLVGVLVVLTALTLGVSFLVPPARPARGGALAEASVAEVLRRPEVRALLAACCCMAAAHGALYGFFSLHAQAAGYSKTAIGTLWTLGVLAEIVVFWAWPRLARRWSLRALLLASFLAAGVRFALVGWGTHVLALLVLAQLLHAATFGVYHAASIAAVHRLFPGGLQATGQTLYSSLSYGVGGSVGMLLAGWSWERLGASASFGISAALALAGAALVTRRVRV